MYLVFTRVPDESYRRRIRSLLLSLCYPFLSANLLPCVGIKLGLFFFNFVHCVNCF